MEDNDHFAYPWFWRCVREAIDSEFITHWLRLTGNTLPRSAIERMIDESSGYGEDVARQFLTHVKDVVYDRIPRPEETSDG